MVLTSKSMRRKNTRALLNALGAQMETSLDSEGKIYQRIGEFAVSFQWLENKLRKIGWFILDPDRSEWPPKGLRSLTNEKLINRVHELFIEALPKCKLPEEVEQEFKNSMDSYAEILHQLRRDRNRILHSAYIELKAGGEAQGLVRSDPRLGVDEETGEALFDQEYLTPNSFDSEMKKIAETALFLNRIYTQLIHRYPNGGA